MNSSRIRINKFILLLGLVVISLFSLSRLAFADTGCTFEPFTTTINQGEQAAISVAVTLPDSSASYELNLGNMPLSVSGGFTTVSAGASSVKKISLLVKSEPDAQTGSFMIPILCRILSGGNISDWIFWKNYQRSGTIITTGE